MYVGSICRSDMNGMHACIGKDNKVSIKVLQGKTCAKGFDDEICMRIALADQRNCQPQECYDQNDEEPVRKHKGNINACIVSSCHDKRTYEMRVFYARLATLSRLATHASEVHACVVARYTYACMKVIDAAPNR